jgi:4-hydroxybenzoate polyprenyltransferase
MPITLHPYINLARLHRPVGIWLLLFPCWWGVALASPNLPPPALLLLFACGAILMRSAGCVYNDIIDKDVDAKVRRTASRPLAAETISLKEASVFLLMLLTCSALILFSLPSPVIVTGFIALGLVFLYPWMKKLTYWPQAFLGFTFNIGVLMGWLSVMPHLSLVPFLFYGGGILWTVGYDTIYAFQDRQDDLLIGIKSSAIATAASPKLFLGLFYAGSILCWGIGGVMASLGGVYGLALSAIAFHFAWQIISFDPNDSENCLKRFTSNTKVGLILFMGIVFSQIIY